MNLTIQSAQLPGAYMEARAALARCEQVDECKDWADKAAAMASYAKQANDDTLLNTARRIQLRAIQRCGEILGEIDGQGARTDKLGGGIPTKLTQRQVAEDAGLSKDQQMQAVRIANVPRDHFEDLVESEHPPTVTQMAELGTRKRVDVESHPCDLDHAKWIFAIDKLIDHKWPLETYAGNRCGFTVARQLEAARAAHVNLSRWIELLEEQEANHAVE